MEYMTPETTKFTSDNLSSFQNDSEGTGSDSCETRSDTFYTGSDIFMTGNDVYGSGSKFGVTRSEMYGMHRKLLKSQKKRDFLKYIVLQSRFCP